MTCSTSSRVTSCWWINTDEKFCTPGPFRTAQATFCPTMKIRPETLADFTTTSPPWWLSRAS
ncbi:hypothetical protein OWM54_00145 [Myxococcus sp. MISCRS1]|uniref:hypothetical protein n=1 Tax=Myxococcus sp. MISCRS1 TaxID=2996786 RepID=UPI00226F2F67|nr:hypothetical protein [Myxococcus sp. MISCRS1]MCY0995535.1 hypothetical protein [Myxococcus sp. MISCRS1]